MTCLSACQKPQVKVPDPHFERTGDLVNAYPHLPVLMQDGRVLIPGHQAQIYNPKNGQFTLTDPMRTNPQSAYLLPSGKIFFYDFWAHNAEIYDPKTGHFALTGPLNNYGRQNSAIIVLNSGNVLLVGAHFTSGVTAEYLSNICLHKEQIKKQSVRQSLLKFMILKQINLD